MNYTPSENFFLCPICKTKNYFHKGQPSSGGFLSGFVWGVEMKECCVDSYTSSIYSGYIYIDNKAIPYADWYESKYGK